LITPGNCFGSKDQTLNSDGSGIKFDHSACFCKSVIVDVSNIALKLEFVIDPNQYAIDVD
jgi:hypothetical protein